MGCRSSSPGAVAPLAAQPRTPAAAPGPRTSPASVIDAKADDRTALVAAARTAQNLGLASAPPAFLKAAAADPFFSPLTGNSDSSSDAVAAVADVPWAPLVWTAAQEQVVMLQEAQRKLLDMSAREERLRTLHCMVLDNSIRETTVAAVRGHTLDDKMRISELVRECGIKDTVVATFTGTRMVDDVFAEIATRKWNKRNLFAFSELADEVYDGVPLGAVPLGLEKSRRYGIINVIIEFDINCKRTRLDLIGSGGFCALLRTRLEWVHEKLAPDARVYVNYRDFPESSKVSMERVKIVTAFLAQLPRDLRPEGIIFEDPSGESMPTALAARVATVRAVMDTHGWSDGEFLIHVHYGYGLAEAVVLECLSTGATGIWCGICKEGAGVGHACSIITLTNLARLGNQWVTSTFDMPALRRAAVEITRLVTGEDPHPTTEIYGARALDKLWDAGMMGGKTFDLAGLFDAQAVVRVSTFTTARMMQERLQHTFPMPSVTLNAAVAEAELSARWPLHTCEEMRRVIREDLLKGRKESYNTPAGLCFLFERAGGTVTPEMEAVVVGQMEAAQHPLILALYKYFASYAAGCAVDARLRANSVDKSNPPAGQTVGNAWPQRMGSDCAPKSAATPAPNGQPSPRASQQAGHAAGMSTAVRFLRVARAAVRRRRLMNAAALGTGDASKMLRSSTALTYRAFYNAFMARYFACYTCDAANTVFAILDVDGSGVRALRMAVRQPLQSATRDGHGARTAECSACWHVQAISWTEFLARAVWAIQQHGEKIHNVDTMISVIMEHYILPEIAQRVDAVTGWQTRRLLSPAVLGDATASRHLSGSKPARGQ